MIKLPVWGEEAPVNSKILCCGTIYRCRKCNTEILMPDYSARFVQSYLYRYCPTCKTRNIFEVD